MVTGTIISLCTSAPLVPFGLAGRTTILSSYARTRGNRGSEVDAEPPHRYPPIPTHVEIPHAHPEYKSASSQKEEAVRDRDTDPFDKMGGRLPRERGPNRARVNAAARTETCPEPKTADPVRNCRATRANTKNRTGVAMPFRNSDGAGLSASVEPVSSIITTALSLLRAECRGIGRQHGYDRREHASRLVTGDQSQYSSWRDHSRR